jgi:hypothetical protein
MRSSSPSALTSRNTSNAKEDSFYPDASSAVGPESDASDDNEKENKIERTQGARFKHVLWGIALLAGVLGLMDLAAPNNNSISNISNNSNNSNISNNSNMVLAKPKPMTVNVANAMAEAPPETESELMHRVEELDAKVREHKSVKGVQMEVDPTGLKLTKELQHATHKLLVTRYGRHASYRVVVHLTFQKSIPDYAEKGADGRVVIEMAPIDLVPVSVFNFLEIARTWKSGAVHRNAGHVLQIQARSAIQKSMPFQEYSPEFSHQKGTTGYAGRPSGPGWYISIADNSKVHGPGSQQKENPHEADSCFGRIVEGFDDVVPRIHSTPQKSWLDKENQILIPSMEILVSDGGGDGGFVPWEPKR